MDNEAVVLMHYQAGRFTGAEVLPPAIAPRYRAARDQGDFKVACLG